LARIFSQVGARQTSVAMKMRTSGSRHLDGGRLSLSYDRIPTLNDVADKDKDKIAIFFSVDCMNPGITIWL
jgi:hypothetical protein